MRGLPVLGVLWWDRAGFKARQGQEWGTESEADKDFIYHPPCAGAELNLHVGAMWEPGAGGGT